MLDSILLCFFVILYLVSEGATEGYTWANADRRRNNIFVRNTLRNKEARGVLDYHAWRFGEVIGILGAAIVSWYFSGPVPAFFCLLSGAYLFGNALYEFILHYIAEGILLVPDRDFHVLGLIIRIPWFYPLILLFFGILLLMLGFSYVSV